MSRPVGPQPGPTLSPAAQRRVWLSAFAAREYRPTPDLPDWPVFETVAWAVGDTLQRVAPTDRDD